MRGTATALLAALRHGFFLIFCGLVFRADDEPGIRQALYNRKLPNGSAYARSGLTLDRWRAFQANELCHISFEALLNGLLAQQLEYPLGIEPYLLVTRLLDPLLATLGTEGRSWRDWATEIGSAFVGSEELLAEQILSSLRDVKLASRPEGLLSALQLIATLWFRWGAEDSSVRDRIQRHAGPGGRSLSAVLHTLNEHASSSVEQAVGQMIRRHIIADHLTIAGQKARRIRYVYLSFHIVRRGRIRWTARRLWIHKSSFAKSHPVSW